jgi:hypothetical protein
MALLKFRLLLSREICPEVDTLFLSTQRRQHMTLTPLAAVLIAAPEKHHGASDTNQGDEHPEKEGSRAQWWTTISRSEWLY